MSSDADGAPARPGGRTARNTAAVLDATLAELGDSGYAGLTVERIAARSGVHKATVYRRWGGVDGLLAASLARSREDGWAPRRTGALRGDLAALGHEVVLGFTGSDLRSVPAAAISAAFQSDRAADALRAFFADRHERSAAVVTEAIERGEAPAGTDPCEVVRAAVAPLYYRLCVSREPVAAADVDRAARLAADAAGTGAFVPPAA
ncbi:TetR family transcriptional regulator [Murinocardiopsis flavida]|uniref:TetR family transcriptional regulator n=1 Tax=Murinocardiopsis flavida TaxID=645275 RepID=A0A2P8DGB6_9ACTN|nr:TetR/AcrR family transcriptional regulator [Murinocardiopsis flavida]PSK96262.1 TetR family transcriptional regulator [Murinocardiopsis flavida]